MKSLAAAVAFLTTLPVGRLVVCDASDVARSSPWFPLVGILLGLIFAGVARLFHGHLPVAVVATLVVILDTLVTGALHYDGLADTADGFGGGKDRDDILRIMRDHSIGSFGGVALAAVVAVKVTAYASILARPRWTAAVIFVPALGRWSILLLTAAFPYARTTASVVHGMGKRSFILGSIVIAAALVFAESLRVESLRADSLRGWLAVGAVAVVSLLFGLYCRRRIGGITGDTLGANLQLCECTALLVFLWTGLGNGPA